MENNTATTPAYQLRFLLIPYKIYISDLKPSYKFILSRIYHFAKTHNNNVYASSKTLGANYGVTEGTISKVIQDARNAGLMALDSKKFIKIFSFESPDNPEEKEIYPAYLMIPEHALFHKDLSCADKIVYALLYYRVNSDDGSVCNPKKELALTLGISVDAFKAKVKKLEGLKLVSKASSRNTYKLYLTHYPTYIQQRLDYTANDVADLSTGDDPQGGEDGIEGGEDGIARGVRTGSHIINNINNINKNITATPLKAKSFDREEHDYTPEWKKAKNNQTSSTVLEFNSPEYLQRRQAVKHLEEISRKRGEAVLEAYMRRKGQSLYQDTKKEKEHPRGPNSAILEEGEIIGVTINENSDTGETKQ